MCSRRTAAASRPGRRSAYGRLPASALLKRTRAIVDGVVDHKLLRVHQLRYSVDVTPYDRVWNACGAVVLLTGCALVVHIRRRSVRDDGA
ncbi:DUF2243 domain-containing protein [Streptomyces vietnamensis]|uniref:DUF2243 domain-containing protein n=1 Tax=Streptomyces vietnamensis TaxID=362257 RepID=UPI0037ABF009